METHCQKFGAPLHAHATAADEEAASLTLQPDGLPRLASNLRFEEHYEAERHCPVCSLGTWRDCMHMHPWAHLLSHSVRLPACRVETVAGGGCHSRICPPVSRRGSSGAPSCEEPAHGVVEG